MTWALRGRGSLMLLARTHAPFQSNRKGASDISSVARALARPQGLQPRPSRLPFYLCLTFHRLVHGFS